MTKARENSDYTGLAADIVAGDTAARAGRKNLILNGSMQVAQRGTTGTLNNGGSGFYSADRFRAIEGGTTSFVFTVSNDTDAPAGFSSSTKWACTTADASLDTGDYMAMDYKIEAQDVQHLNYGTPNALTTTVSFWVKSNKTGTYILWMYQQDDARQVQVPYTINSVDTWERKTCVVPADPTGIIDNNNGAGIYFRWVFGTGTDWTSGTADTQWATDNGPNRFAGQTVNLADSTSNYLNITGIQLELGSVATDFEHRSYGEELALCQRYYETGSSNHYGSSDSGSNIVAQGDFAVVKRATPTMVYGTWSYSSVSTTGTGSPTNYQTDSRHWRCFMNVATARNSAYLSGSWAAEAEL